MWFNRILGTILGIVGYVCLLMAFCYMETWPVAGTLVLAYMGLFLMTMALFVTDTIGGGVRRW